MTDIEYADKFRFRRQVGTENCAVMGAHFQGKTYLTKHLISKPLLGVYRQWVWDYHGKFSDLAPANVVHSVDALRYGTQFLRPSDRSPEQFFKFCEKVNALRNLEVIIDETHNYCSAHRIDPRFAVLLRDKGNAHISYTCIFQRPAEIHKSLISNAKHRFMFAMDVPTDIDYLVRYIGIEAELFLPPRLRKYYKEEPQLPPHSFIYRNQEEMRPVVVPGGLKV